MAIPIDRLKIDTIAKLTEVAFDKMSDITKSNKSSNSIVGSTATASVPANQKGTNGGKSVFAPPTKNTVSPANAAIANFDPNSNQTSNLPKAFKKSSDSLHMDRTLVSNTNYPLTASVFSTDALLASNKPITPNKDFIHPSDEASIDKLVDDVGKTQLGNQFKTYLDQKMFKDKIKAGLSKVNSPLGNTLKSKVNLTKFISPCKGVKFNNNFDMTGLFNSMFLSSLFDGILCQGADSLLNFIQGVIKIDATNAPSVLNALSGTMNKDNDPNIMNKLMAMKAIKDNTPSPSAGIYTRGITGKVLHNIKYQNTKTNSSVSQYLNTTNALDTLDPNWDKNDAGTIDVSSIRGNTAMKDMANNYLISTPSTPVYTGVVNNPIDRNASIAIVNSF